MMILMGIYHSNNMIKVIKQNAQFVLFHIMKMINTFVFPQKREV